MIPTIEQIIEDLLAGSITKSQAVTWLHVHAESANESLRDAFAAQCISGRVSHQEDDVKRIAKNAYLQADAMMKARES